MIWFFLLLCVQQKPAVASLPELTERKLTLDKHTKAATALLGARMNLKSQFG